MIYYDEHWLCLCIWLSVWSMILGWLHTWNLHRNLHWGRPQIWNKMHDLDTTTYLKQFIIISKGGWNRWSYISILSMFFSIQPQPDWGHQMSVTTGPRYAKCKIQQVQRIASHDLKPWCQSSELEQVQMDIANQVLECAKIGPWDMQT